MLFGMKETSVEESFTSFHNQLYTSYSDHVIQGIYKVYLDIYKQSITCFQYKVPPDQ